jgi:death on curing protein
VSERTYLTIAEVLTIHQRQIDEYGGARGIRDSPLLESAIFRPQTGYYDSAAEEATALMESLANNFTHSSIVRGNEKGIHFRHS